MATLETLAEGIRRANAAGDIESVKKLGAAYRQMQARTSAAGEGVQLPAVGQPDRGLVGQMTSGMTEGAANLLSLPNSVEMGLRSIGPAIGNAMGGDFGMPTESWLPDAGQNLRNFADNTGAMTPVADDPASRFTRRVGQEVGAGIIPAASMASKASTPLRMALAETAALTGSGVGAAAAQEVFPDNPAAELVGQLVGGFTPVGLINQAERMAMKTAAPSLDDLRAAKNAAYDQADNLGVQYAPEEYDQLVGKLQAAAARESLVPERHGAPASVLNDFVKRQGQPHTLTELDKMRQIIVRDLMQSPQASDRTFGYLFADEVDDFIAKVEPKVAPKGPQISVGGAPMSGMFDTPSTMTASEAITAARKANRVYKKTETFDKSLYRADLNAAAAGSGGNINNTTRQQIKAVLTNDAMRRQFSPAELAEMEKVVRQGRVENTLRGIGKVAPGGNGLMTALNIGAVATNPLLAAVPIAGTVAKVLADRGTVNGGKAVRALIAQGGKRSVPNITPNTEKVVQALLAAQASNNNVQAPQVLEALLRVKGLN